LVDLFVDDVIDGVGVQVAGGEHALHGEGDVGEFDEAIFVELGHDVAHGATGFQAFLGKLFPAIARFVVGGPVVVDESVAAENPAHEHYFAQARAADLDGLDVGDVADEWVIGHLQGFDEPRAAGAVEVFGVLAHHAVEGIGPLDDGEERAREVGEAEVVEPRARAGQGDLWSGEEGEVHGLKTLCGCLGS